MMQLPQRVVSAGTVCLYAPSLIPIRLVSLVRGGVNQQASYDMEPSSEVRGSGGN